MIKTSMFILCLASVSAQGAEPPDWYAHIPASQQAALLATRSAQLGHAAIGVPGVLPYREQGNEQAARYTRSQGFDASALVHAPERTLYDHNRNARQLDRLLREYRQPNVNRTHRGLVRALECAPRSKR